jgi:hypothetical protein
MEPTDLRGRTLEELVAGRRQRITRPTIRRIAGNLPYLEARRIADSQGGLPRNVFTNQVLADPNVWQRLPSDYFPAWQREILVYPRPGKVFKKGEDIIETFESNGERFKVTYPAHCIPKEARKRGTALFVDLKNEPRIERNSIIVDVDTYEEVTILDGFPQEDSFGRIDRATGVPLTNKNIYDLPAGERGYLWRTSSQGIRPVVRDSDRVFYGRRKIICANYRFDNELGVGVESREDAPQVSVSK